MDEPDPVRPETIVISRLVVDSLAMATLLAACLATAATVIVIFAKDFTAAPSVISALFLGLGIPVLLGANLYVAVYWSRVASRAEVGDDLSLRTLGGRHRYRWEELGRMVVFEQGLPVPGRCVVKMVFTDGRRYVVFADREQGEAMYRRARQQPTAQGWDGAPLPRAMALTLIGLGVVALALGVLIICVPVADVARNGVGANGAETEQVNPVELAIAAVVVPLAGLAGVAVGAYHIVRRPVVIRPGVEYLREGDPAGRGESL
jgi:hypothetical protein